MKAMPTALIQPPWIADGPFVKDIKNRTICDCRTIFDVMNPPHTDLELSVANARIIAMIPEFIDACDTALRLIETLRYASEEMEEYMKMSDNIRSALKKVRGEI